MTIHPRPRPGDHRLGLSISRVSSTTTEEESQLSIDPLEDRRETVRAALRAPQICLGTMYFGTTVTEREAHAVLDRFAERGGRIIDTANCYCFWTDGGTGEESERVIGRWLAANPSVRPDVVIATKVGSRPETPSSPWPQTAEGLASSVIHEQLDRSLERLQTDAVDLYYAHIDDAGTAQEETVAAFGEVVSSGRAHLLGASNFTVDRLRRARVLAQAAGTAQYEAIQVRATFLPPRPDADFSPQVALTDEMLDYAAAEDDLQAFGFSPLLSGAYTRADREIPEQYRQPGTDSLLTALRRAAAEVHLTRNQLVLAHLIGRQRVVPIVGTSSVSQLDEALDVLTALPGLDLTMATR